MDSAGNFNNELISLYIGAQEKGIPVKFLFTSNKYRDKIYSPTELLHVVLKNKGFDQHLRILLSSFQTINQRMTPAISPYDFIMFYIRYLASRRVNEVIYEIVVDFLNEINSRSEFRIRIRFVDDKITLEENISKLEEEYKSWTQAFDRIVNSEKQALANIGKVNKVIKMMEPITTTKPVIMKTTLHFKPLIDGQGIKVDHGVDIFDSAIPSQDVPFIQWNNHDNTPHYRIFVDKTVKNINVHTAPINKQSTDTLYIRVLVGRDGEAINSKSYITAVYSLTTGILKVPCPVTIHTEGDGTSIVTERLRQALPNLVLGKHENVNIQGHFEYEGERINNLLLHEIILNDNGYVFVQPDGTFTDDPMTGNPIPAFSTYLYAEEMTQPTADRRRLDLYYRSFTKPGEGSKSYTVHINIPDVSATNIIKISRADNEKALEEFMSVFSRLLALYILYKDVVYEKLSTFIDIPVEIDSEAVDPSEEGEEGEEGEEDDSDDKPKSSSRKKSTKFTTDSDDVSKNNRLKRKFPQIFDVDAPPGTKHWSRSCSCKYQPIAVEKDEVDGWKDLEIDGTERQVWQFPPPNPDKSGIVPAFYYTCPDDSIPYPTLIKNPNPNNMNIYPMLPCCALQDNTTKQAAYWKKPAPKTTKVVASAISTSKFLDSSSQVGKLESFTPALEEFLKSFIESRKVSFLRHYVPRSPSSLIHAVLIAVQKSDYINGDDDKKNEIVNRYRRKMSNLNLSVYRQELYDESDEEIATRINNTESFLDPYILYRGVEEVLHVNIVVFNPSGYLHPPPFVNKSDLPKGPVLEIPRYQITHIRNLKDSRPTVIIMKHLGSEGDYDTYPHCELIIAEPEKVAATVDKEEHYEEPEITSRLYSFGKNMTKILQEALNFTLRTAVWSFPLDNLVEPRAESIEMRINPFSDIDWLEYDFGIRSSSKYIIESQYIDSYGKARALNVKMSKDEKLTIFIPPAQPFNIPNNSSINATTTETAIKFFGTPSDVHTRGLWFAINDYKWGIFVPCVPKPEDISERAPFPFLNLDNVTENPVNNTRLIKRNAHILAKLVIRCWQMSSLDFVTLTDVEDWCSSYMVIDSDMENIPYPPTILKRRMPEIDKDAEDACDATIKSLNRWWPEYFKGDGKIHLNEELANKLQQLLEFVYIVNDGASIDKNVVFDELYNNSYDFTHRRGTIVLIGQKQLTTWKEYQTRDHINIKVKLDISQMNEQDPVLFRQDERTYIVQNIQGGNLSQALCCTLTWQTRGFNTSLNSPLLDAGVYSRVVRSMAGEDVDPKITFIIYGISTSNELIVVDVVPKTAEGMKDTSNCLEILRYDENYYAALLPL